MKKLKCTFVAIMILLFAAITVQAADGIAISQTRATVNVGDILDLAVTGTDKAPSWTSYNPNVASVDRFGKVTAVKKGNTNIRARVGYSYKLCSVKVVDSSIKLNKKTATIYHGGTSVNTVQLKATARGASKDVIWESSNPDVAVVDAKGKVTSVAEGTTTITATANGKIASCYITVKESNISLNMDSLQVSTKGVGSSIKVVPSVVGSKKNVKWTTSDKTVATVSGGRIVGKKTGTATITATANGVSAECVAYVVEGLVSINEEKILLYAGGTNADTKQLKTNAAKTDLVTWASSNPAVATVNNNGLVTPVSGGIAIVTAECNGKNDACIVAVKQTSTDIMEDSVQLKTKGADKTYTLNKEITGKTKGIKWSTSNKAVVTVSNGKVTAKKAGTAHITATANGVSDTVTINVADFNPTIRLNQKQYTLFTVKGNTVSLKAAVDGASKTVVWTSNDSSVATVTNKGKVTAIGEGTATITAEANGVSAQCNIEVVESKVILDRERVTLQNGEKYNLGYDIVGASQSIKWATTNNKVATVSKGIITAKNYGEADIKATANGVTSVCHITVGSCQHEYKNTVIKQPSCGENGVLEYVCGLCGDTYTEDIPATGQHDFKWVTDKEAGCTDVGYKRFVCTVCGIKDKVVETEPLGHDFGGWKVIREPNEADMKEGIKERVCNRCGKVEQEIIPFEGHIHHPVLVATKEATCEDNACDVYMCECGYSYEVATGTSLGHEWGEWHVVKEPGMEDGAKERKCERCGKAETQTIPKEEHTHEYKTEVVDPECESKGYTLYICTICGDTKKDNWVDQLGHEEGPEIEIIKPTCTEHGKYEIHCIRCDKYMGGSNPIAPHEYEEVIIEPTCTEAGRRYEACKVCGKEKSAGSTISPGHKYDEWKITKQPANGVHDTVSDFGERVKKCQGCGLTVKESIVNIEIEGGAVKQVCGRFMENETEAMLAKVNGMRREVGAADLKLNPYMKDLAYIRAAELSYKRSHDRPSGKDLKYINANNKEISLGENIAYGFNLDGEGALIAWKNSSGHYANMTNSLYSSYYGMGFIVGDEPNEDGRWVQLFAYPE